MAEELILDNIEGQKKRRRELIPIWIKVFIWIFFITGALGILAQVIAIFSPIRFDLALYGFETNDPHTLAGLIISFVFIFKGIVSYGLWTEKNWGINLALIEGALGIILCIASMYLANSQTDGSFNISFRFEIVIIAFYMLKLWKIKPLWEGVNSK